MVEQIREHFFRTIHENNKSEWLTYDKFVDHVPEVERWATKILETHKEGNEEIVLSAVWLHDIGQMICENEDHAIDSEVEARRFLTGLGVESEKLEAICHAVRSHRCRDIMPNTLEAKILAAADSASHMTSRVYFEVGNKWGKQAVLSKLERDYRDVGIFPELKAELTPFYKSWAEILNTIFE